MRIRIILLTTLLALGAALPAAGQIDLRFDPADSTLEWGDPATISVWLDDAVTIRSVDLTVSYDTTRVASVDGVQGDLFLNSGHFIWEGFEEIATGTWHGYAIIKDVESRTAGEMVLGTSTVYAAIKRMHRDGLVREADTTITEITCHARGVFRALGRSGTLVDIGLPRIARQRTQQHVRLEIGVTVHRDGPARRPGRRRQPHGTGQPRSSEGGAP